MGNTLPTGPDGRAAELLELRDRLDLLDAELRDRRLGLTVGPLVAGILSAPVLVLLALSRTWIFFPFLLSLLVVGAVLFLSMAAERRRLRREREEVVGLIEAIEQGG